MTDNLELVHIYHNMDSSNKQILELVVQKEQEIEQQFQVLAEYVTIASEGDLEKIVSSGFNPRLASNKH